MTAPQNNTASGASTHRPVMLDEVIAAMAPRDGAIYLDGTFGGGGYSKALLAAADCTVYGIDRDPDAIARGGELARRSKGRLTVLHGRYADMESLMRGRGIDSVDGVALDLGASSDQLDDPARGFSFHGDGPLDMRMDPSNDGGATAADLVNTLPEEELATIFHRYGEEKKARRVARAIAAARQTQPITGTAQLAELVRRVVPPARDGLNPATRTFQALRIHVNNELGELARGLGASEALLAPGGHLCIVSFHSLEDRAVKNFLRERSDSRPRPSRHLPDAGGDARASSFRLLFRGARRPGGAETAANPRARSARLRAAIRTDAPPWPAAEDHGGARAW